MCLLTISSAYMPSTLIYLKCRSLKHPQPDSSYQSPQPPSAFFPLPGVFFIALVPMLLFVSVLLSAAAAKLSQKSFLSSAGPFGGAPKLSQKSRFSGSLDPVLEPPGPPPGCSPSTKRFRDSAAVLVPAVTVWPTWAAACRACSAMLPSASCGFVSMPLRGCFG